MHIHIVLFDGFDLLDAIAPYEAFTAAAMYSNEEVTVKVVFAEGERLVTSGVNHLQVQAKDLSHKGSILVPGASGSVHDNGSDSVPFKLQQATETELNHLLKKAMITYEWFIRRTACPTFYFPKHEWRKS